MTLIPPEIEQQVIESCDYVAALERLLDASKTYLRSIRSLGFLPEREALRQAVEEAELLR